jgi:hypothetical protein
VRFCIRLGVPGANQVAKAFTNGGGFGSSPSRKVEISGHAFTV